MPPTKLQILNIYKCLLREASKFPAYNFRNYALRRIKDSFRANKDIDLNSIEPYFIEAKRNLELIKRQIVISHMYSTEKLVIENEKNLNS